MELRDKKSLIKWIVLLACIVAGVVAMILVFHQRVERKVRTKLLEEVADIATDNAVKFHDELIDVTTSGQVAARLIEGKENLTTEDIRQILDAIVDCTPLYRAIYYVGDTVIAGSDDHMPDITQFEVPESAKKAEINVYLYLPEGELADQETALIMLPVAGDKGRLLLYYPMERVKSLFADTRNASYGQNLFYVVTDNSGNILYRGHERNPFTEDESLWDNLDKEYQKEVEKVVARMRSMGRGNVALSASGERRTLVYASVPASSWLIVEGVRQEYLNQQIKKEWKETGRMLYLVIMVSAAIVIYIFVKNMGMRRENLKENKGLQEKADTDLLTGLNNKLSTERKIKEFMQENPDTLSMMFLLDIDDFKNINDTMGHAFGDEVLRKLGIYIGSNFRVTDIIGRTGGDEFTIFLKALKDDSNVIKEAEKLLTFFRGFEVGEYTKYSVTASIGAAVFPEHGNEFEALYKAADQALYKAKRRGKNQLAFYDDRDRKDDTVQNVQ